MIETLAEYLLTLLLNDSITRCEARDILALAAKERKAAANVAPSLLSNPNADKVMAKVMEELRCNRFVYAIKAFKEGFNTDLLTAKRAVEQLRAEAF